MYPSPLLSPLVTVRLKTQYFVLLFLFWQHHGAGEILVRQPGVDSADPAVVKQSLNPWTAREGPEDSVLKGSFTSLYPHHHIHVRMRF